MQQSSAFKLLFVLLFSLSEKSFAARYTLQELVGPDHCRFSAFTDLNNAGQSVSACMNSNDEPISVSVYDENGFRRDFDTLKPSLVGSFEFPEYKQFNLKIGDDGLVRALHFDFDEDPRRFKLKTAYPASGQVYVESIDAPQGEVVASSYGSQGLVPNHLSKSGSYLLTSGTDVQGKAVGPSFLVKGDDIKQLSLPKKYSELDQPFDGAVTVKPWSIEYSAGWLCNTIRCQKFPVEHFYGRPISGRASGYFAGDLAHGGKYTAAVWKKTGSKISYHFLPLPRSDQGKGGLGSGLSHAYDVNSNGVAIGDTRYRSLVVWQPIKGSSRPTWRAMNIERIVAKATGFPVKKTYYNSLIINDCGDILVSAVKSTKGTSYGPRSTWLLKSRKRKCS